MNLLLVQHGQAKTEAEDPARSLNVVGVESAEKVAKWLYVSGVGVTEIRHSGKRRAEQTASIFAKHLSPRQGVAATSGLNPKDDVRRVADELKGSNLHAMASWNGGEDYTVNATEPFLMQIALNAAKLYSVELKCFEG